MQGWVRRVLVILAVVAVAIAGVRFSRAANDTFTGCLSSDGGLSRVALGTEPTRACGSTQAKVTWTSGGPQGEPGADGTVGVEGQACPEGQALAGFDANGGMVCGVP